MNKEIFIGATETTLVTFEVDMNERNDFSMTGMEYERNLFTEEQGEQRARDSLEDGELWKMDIQAEKTTSSLDDWVEMVMNVDGWEEVVGDVSSVGDYYTQIESCGQIDMSLRPIIKPAITEADISTLLKVWKKYHLKPVSRKTQEKIANILGKYPAFELDQMLPCAILPDSVRMR